MKGCSSRPGKGPLALVLGAALVQIASAAVFSGVSGDTFIDTASGARTLHDNTITVCYGPEVAGRASTPIDHVVVRQVVHVGTSAQATNVQFTSTSSATAYGVCSVSQVTQGYFQRWVHTAYDANDEVVGEPLTADFVFPLTSATSAGVTVDSRVNSLQQIATSGAVAPLIYSTTWATSGVPVRIEITCSDGTATNSLFASAAPADGVHAFIPAKLCRSGDYTLTYAIYDGADEILDTGVACFHHKVKKGLVVVVR